MSTPQQEADRMLAFWQLQAAMGIAPAERRIPANSNENDDYERELAAIREVLREKERLS